MDVVIRAAIAYIFIIFILRIVGRRELSSLAPTDLVLLIVLGDLIQNGVTQSDDSVTGIFLAISTFSMLALATSYVTFKSRRAKTFIEGEPLILVDHGKPVESNLQSQRLTVDDIAEQSRASGIESLDEVKWCVLESSGSMSFIKAD
jgi:uncharacterized membrane protein YcaP (DUF421 family)